MAGAQDVAYVVRLVLDALVTAKALGVDFKQVSDAIKAANGVDLTDEVRDQFLEEALKAVNAIGVDD